MNTKSEYKGIYYYKLSAQRWRILWPSGAKGIIVAETEFELKEKLDNAIATLHNK